jgi:hypothetical protein
MFYSKQGSHWKYTLVQGMLKLLTNLWNNLAFNLELNPMGRFCRLASNYLLGDLMVILVKPSKMKNKLISPVRG